MAHYPINISLVNRKCIVVGGGTVAERKVEMLLEFGGDVTVVAPDLTPGIERLAESGEIRLVREAYPEGMLDGAFLVIAGTDDREVNRAVSSDAQRLGILVNVVDDPELCTFFVPAVVRRGDLVISVSTSGKSPSLARRVREEIEQTYGPEWGELADLLGELRDEVKARHATMQERGLAYTRILDSDVRTLLAQGKRDEALERARELI